MALQGGGGQHMQVSVISVIQIGSTFDLNGGTVETRSAHIPYTVHCTTPRATRPQGLYPERLKPYSAHKACTVNPRTSSAHNPMQARD